MKTDYIMAIVCDGGDTTIIQHFKDTEWESFVFYHFTISEWSHFLRLMVTTDNDGVSTHLMIILMIEFGIWVIRASGNFIRSGPTFQG